MSSGDALYYSDSAALRFKSNEPGIRRPQLYSLPHREFDIAERFGTFTTMPAAEAVLASPLFGAWLDRIAQAAYSEAPNKARFALGKQRAQHIGNYIVTAAFWGGNEIETQAWQEDGYVMIPEIGRVALQGADGLVSVEVHDGLTIHSDDTTIHLHSEMLATESDIWQPLRYIESDDVKIALNDIDPNRNIFRYPPSPRLTDAEYRQWATTFADAWSFLQDHDPHLANIVRAHLTTIVPAPSEPLTHSKTMAAGASLGVIGFNENRDPTRLLSQIAFGIRKDMALALRTEMPEIYPEEGMHTPVYPPSREGYGIAAHLQDDTFINVGLARFYHSLLQSGDSKLRDYYELSFARWYTESRQNLDAWKQSGYGQDRNAWLPNSLGNELYALKHTFDSISEAVRQTVATNARDRHANWRLRTIIPDPQAIIYLRDVWTSGRDCPYITVPGTLNQSNEAYIHIGQRTRYVLAEVKVKEPALFAGVTVGSYDPKLFGEPTPGDIAFANDNIAEARRYFTASIRQRGSNTDAWAGLALTFEHEHSPAAEVFTQQPELAAALYATIGDATIDPENIAAWLAPSRVAKLCLGA